MQSAKCLNPMWMMWNWASMCMASSAAKQRSMQCAAKPAAAAKKDIVATALAGKSFTTLAKALEAAGLVSALKESGPFTVFAPTDDAFAKLPAGALEDLLKPENKEKLLAILKYHVAPGRILSGEVLRLRSVRSLTGQNLKVTAQGGLVMIDDATVTRTDIECSNGVIHVLDSVLLPQ